MSVEFILLTTSNTTMAKKEKAPEDYSASGLIYYTDGGARSGPTGPNPGYAGYGIHGYSYNYTEAKKGLGLPGIVATNQGYQAKTALGKEDIKAVKPLQYFEGYGTIDGIQSNNVAEIQAATYALAHAAEYKIKHPDLKEINIITDSRGVVDTGNQWLERWVANGWTKSDGSPIKGRQWWELLNSQIQNHKSQGIQVNFTWVKGHSGDVGNEQADQMATLAVNKNRLAEPGSFVKEKEIDGFWTKTETKHPLITQRSLYFMSDMATHTPGEYYLGNHGKDDEMLGTRIPDGYYSFVKLKAPEPILEIVIKRQIEVTAPEVRIMVGKLNKILMPEVTNKVLEYGPHCFFRENKRRFDLTFLDDEEVTREIDPPIQAWNAIAALNEVKILYYEVVNQDARLSIYPITDLIYESDEKGKTALKKEFGTGYCEITYTPEAPEGFEPMRIKLIMGIDLPARNALKRIEADHPEIKLVVWKDAGQVLRHATFVSTDSGSGIFVSWYSNKTVLKPKKVEPEVSS